MLISTGAKLAKVGIEDNKPEAIAAILRCGASTLKCYLFLEHAALADKTCYSSYNCLTHVWCINNDGHKGNFIVLSAEKICLNADISSVMTTTQTHSVKQRKTIIIFL